MSLADGQLTLGEAARAVGGWAWAENALYEVVGGWAGAAAEGGPKLYLEACSQHHAWRAARWRDELPGRLVQAYAGPGPGPDEVTRPFSPASQALVAALSDLEGDSGRLAAYHRVVLGRAVHEYRRWEAKLSPVSDRPLARALGFALSDTMADWATGAGVLAAMSGPGLAGPAADACARLDVVLVGSEVVFGG